MKFVIKSIWILAAFLVFENVLCQNGYSDQSKIHLKHLSQNGEVETNSSFTNVIQNEPKSLSFSSVNGRHELVVNDNNFSDYERADRGRTNRKIYRIKNPFHHPDEDESRQKVNIGSQDSETGASNLYAGMQYTLPPEEFLQQMRSESQYNQQQQPQLQPVQISTPSPTFGYTATPQPQYQYSTVSSNYNNVNQQNNLTPQSEPKYSPQFYNNYLNSYQYHNAHSFGIEAIQSTPSSVTLYLSTSSPNNQYIGTPSSNYVSSSSPVFSSTPSNSQSYISSTLSNVPTGTPTINNGNRHSLSVDRDLYHYGTNYRDTNQNLYVNHFDNSANGFKFPSMQQQYQNEVPSTTQISVSSIYPDTSRDNWQNSMHFSVNSLPNSRSEYTHASQQNILSNYQDTQQYSNTDNLSNDVNQIGSMSAANNVVLSIVQPDDKTYAGLKNREKEIAQQNKQEDVYSHGDYGWKLEGRKPLVNYDVNLPINYPNQQNNYQTDGSSLSFSYRQLDNSKNHDYEQKSRFKTETVDAQEFAKAAAKAQENMKSQQETYYNNYISNARYPQNLLTNADPGHYMITNSNQKSLTNDNTNFNGQTDPINQLSHYQNSRENIFDNKVKQPFDQENDLQNFVKIHGANIMPNIESRQQVGSALDSNNKFLSANYSKEINENVKQFLKPYSENYRIKSNDYFSSDSTKRLEPSYDNLKKYEPVANPNSVFYKPDLKLSFNSLGHPNSGRQLVSNIQEQPVQSSQNQGSSDSSLKLNDIPYWLQGIKNMQYSPLQTGANQDNIHTVAPLLLNQNINSHQIDIATSILKKILRDKQIEMNSEQFNAPQTLLATIMDLSMANEYLKGKASDVSPSFRNQVNQPNPVRWDMTQLNQFLAQNDKAGQYSVLSNVLGSHGSPFFELHTGNRSPYQGVKYSRSQEEAETLIPITDSTHNHPIGAVMEQDDLEPENREALESDMEASNNVDFPLEVGDDKPKLNPNYRIMNSRYRNSNPLLHDRSTFRKNPKILIGEPYPLLKPPPVRGSKGRVRNKFDNNRRQRINKYKMSRIVKREPMFEEDSHDDSEENVPILVRSSQAGEKFDNTQISVS